MPLTEIHQGDFSPLFRYTLAIMLLAIGGAWLFIRIQNRPLVDLEHARVPLTEIHQGDFSPLFRYTLAIMLLAIGGAWLFIRIQNRPLVDLEHAALQVGKGIIPPPLREYGASG